MITFFLRRPHFAAVMSFIVLLAGLVTIPTLPISQYPQISPPTVTVTSQYPGASAEMVMRSVTTPLEININGADGLQYMQSYSSANGTSVITCTFALGTDPTTDQTNVQHGVDLHARAAAVGGNKTRASASRRARATSRSRWRCSRRAPPSPISR